MSSVVDLYCGAGGFSLGAWLAGFEVLAGIDNDPDVTSKFENNFPNSKLCLADLDTDEIQVNLNRVANRHIVGVVGGPPCQGISLIGRRDITDERNRLVVRFFQHIAKIRPNFFVMENVPALGSDAYSGLLEEALGQVPSSYSVLKPMLLDAGKFGAATRRKRFVIVGYDPSRVDRVTEAQFEPPSLTTLVTVQDAIADVPRPQSVYENVALPYREIESISLYAKQMRACPAAELGSALSREYCLTGRVTGNSGTRHSAEVQRRFAHTVPGAIDPISRYVRLQWDRPAPVLRAGTGRDRGSYQAARPIHPAEPRVITVREAARIQGFPDWFQFSETKWHSHRMIGNSISPLFGAALLSVFRSRTE
ncbi:DNA cytosine methyltransferase [Candidatus Poriferisodalis sp.]|uniref:DNA cytosine methyltransferase n=1 Tax=Candidatus Poriferisodalis sp. TaxID=3101277 RepID=UPI003D1302B6